MSILNPSIKKQTVDALVKLAEMGETIAEFKPIKILATKVLADTFMTLYHAKGMTKETAKTELEAITKALAVRLEVDKVDGSDLPGAWRQYKSDTLKALELTKDSPKDRAAHTTMSALKKFILSRGLLDQFYLAGKGFKENARKVPDIKARDTHMKRLDAIVQRALDELKEYADKHAISLVSARADKEEAAPAKPAKAETKRGGNRKKKDAPIIEAAQRDDAAPGMDERDAA